MDTNFIQNDKSPKKGNRNKTAGSNLEREVVKLLKEHNIYPKAVTTRAESRNLDNQGVDICNTPGTTWQCKCEVKTVNYHKLISDLKLKKFENPVIVHKKTEKSLKGRFVPKGTYAIVDLDFFIELLKNQKHGDKT